MAQEDGARKRVSGGGEEWVYSCAQAVLYGFEITLRQMFEYRRKELNSSKVFGHC